MIAVSERLMNNEFTELFTKQWNNDIEFCSDDNDTLLYCKPFKICVLQNFLSNKTVIEKIAEEMTKVEMDRKQMDLYEFYQSTDLAGINLPFLKQFYDNMESNVMPWIEKLTGIKVNRVSASCSMYNCGDYLLVHDDMIKDRRIAYVYYISPWKGAENWNSDMGGALELFETDANGYPKFPICKSFSPKNNQFIFFKVDGKSFHQVGEVTNLDYPRLTINGWLYGADNIESANTLPLKGELCLSDMINADYLNKEIIKNIQSDIEESSEISLENYLLPEKFKLYLCELENNKTFEWSIKGPANNQHYEVLKLSTVQGALKEFVELFSLSKWFDLLNAYTDLDLDDSIAKCNIVEIQRWKHGCYTVLEDADFNCENYLDIVFYLNAAENVGVIHYIDSETANEDIKNKNSALLTVTPKDNTLNIIYRTEGTTKFTKYVSKRTQLSGFVYIIVCNYKVCNE